MVTRRIATALLLAAAVAAGCGKSQPFQPSQGPPEGAWRQTSGPSSEVVWSLTSSGSALIAGTYYSGLIRSTDLGATWTEVAPLQITSFAKIGDWIYAGGFGGVWISYDGGLTWDGPRIGLPVGITINSLAARGTTLFAGGYAQGVFRSTNSGANWNAISTGLPAATTPLSILPRASDVFIGTANGVYRSTDDGATWSPTAPLPSGDIRAMHARGSEIFAAVGSSGIFVSTDDGTTWESTDGLARGVYAFAVDGARLFALAQGGAYGSVNGRDWERLETGIPEYVGAASFAAAGSNLFIATLGRGVLRTTDLSTWNVSSGPPAPGTWVGPAKAFIHHVFSAGGKVLAALDDHSGARTSDRGASWLPTSTPLPQVRCFGVQGTTWFAGLRYGIARSDDDGRSWTALTNGLPSLVDIGAIAATASVVVAGEPLGGTWRSIDGGDHWTPVTTLRTSVLSLASDGTRIFAGTLGMGVYRSTDHGATWVPAGAGLPKDAIIRSLAFAESRLYAGTAGVGVFVSANGGTLWSPTTLAEGQVVSISARGPRVAAVMADGKTWLSFDSGGSWALESDGLGDAVPYSVAAGEDGFYVGTSKAVWRLGY